MSAIASSRTAPATDMVSNEALARVPMRTFGENDWVTLALKQCSAYLQPAIAGGKPYRIASAVRALMHVPTPEQIDDVIEAVCDTVLADAYTTKNSRLIANVTQARPVIASVLNEYAERNARAAAEPAALRETIDGYVRMAALHDAALAVRLEAVGELAGRIAVAMHLPATIVAATESAGRLHDIGTMSPACDRADTSHALIGEAFIASVPALRHLAPLVRSHHERYDGLGKPDGLSGDEIPMPARIVGVAARFFELVDGEGRHEPMAPNDACHDIALQAGSAFDPAVVNTTLELLTYRRRTNRSA